jgi:hypothetical protein
MYPPTAGMTVTVGVILETAGTKLNSPSGATEATYVGFSADLIMANWLGVLVMAVGNITLPFVRFATVNLLPLGQIESWETVTLTPLVARLSTPFIVSVLVGPVLFVITTGEILLAA